MAEEKSRIYDVAKLSDGTKVYTKTVSDAVTYTAANDTSYILTDFLNNLTTSQGSTSEDIKTLSSSINNLDSSIVDLYNSKQDNISDYVVKFLNGTAEGKGITAVVQGAKYSFLKLQYTTNKVKGGGQNIFGVGSGLSLNYNTTNGQTWALLDSAISLTEVTSKIYSDDLVDIISST